MSKLIKSNFAPASLEGPKLINIKNFSHHTPAHGQEDELNSATIKAEQLKQEAGKIMQQAEQTAKEMKEASERQLREARQTIEDEKANWALEKSEWIEAAKQEGFNQGYDAGRQAGLSEYEQFIQEAKRVVALSELTFKKQIEQAEPTILTLAVQIADKIIGTNLKEAPELFSHIVKSVMQEAREHQNVQIHVHPSRFELVLKQQEELQALLSRPNQSLYIYPDDQLSENGCLLETSYGRIDASIDSQLLEVKTKLLTILEGELVHEHA